MKGSDPFAASSGVDIDVEAPREYTVQSYDDAETVAEQLVEYDEFNELLEQVRGPGGDWRDTARFAATIGAYVGVEWDYVDRLIRADDEYNRGSDIGADEIEMTDYQLKIKRAYEMCNIIRGCESGENPAPSDSESDGIWVASDLVMSYDAAVAAVEEPDVEGLVRHKVIMPWHPEDLGFDREQVDEIDKVEAVQRTANILDDAFEYVYPEKEVRGWENVLHVYDRDRGIYRPRGEGHIEDVAEAALGAYSTNNIISELVAKLKRRNRMDEWDMRDADPHPYRLVVGNGILDLATGELDEYDASEYHRTRIDVNYDPDAECPEIDAFFHDIVAEDDVPTLYRLVSHTLPREYIDEKAAMLVGDGNNGKSAFLNLLEAFLGEWNISGRSLQDLSDNRWASSDLHGAMANLSGDMSDQEASDLSTFKQLTGSDTLTGDIKFESPVRFENYASLIFASNGVPDLPDSDMAVWQRWVYINFPNRFGPDGNKDAVPMRVLLDRITAEEELQGLLARCVEEIKAYHDGRQFFPSVGDAHQVRKRMKKAAEPVYRFASEMLKMVPGDEVESPEESKVWKARVRKAYTEYAREEDLPIVDDAQFGQRLLNLRDFDISSAESRAVGPSSGRNRVYTGIQLTDEAEALLATNDSDEEDDGDDSEDGSEEGELTDDYDSDEDASDEGGIPDETARRAIETYVSDHPDADVYQVMREFGLDGEAFDGVERILASADREAKEEDVETNTDADEHDASESKSASTDDASDEEETVELSRDEREGIKEHAADSNLSPSALLEVASAEATSAEAEEIVAKVSDEASDGEDETENPGSLGERLARGRTDGSVDN